MVRLLPVLASVVLPTTAAVSEIKMAIESLADFVSRVRNSKGLSLLDVEKQSARRGHRIAGSYVSRIENGHKKNLTKKTIVALACGLGEPEAVITAVWMGRSTGKNEDSRDVQLLAHFHELSDEYKDNLLKIARLFNAEHGARTEEVKTAKKRAGSRAA